MPKLNPLSGVSHPDNLLTNARMILELMRILIRVAVRFFSGVPHPHLLGVCCPNRFFLYTFSVDAVPRFS